MRFDVVVNLMTVNAVQKSRIFITGGGRQWRPIIHVGDTASAFVSLLDRAASEVNTRVFKIGSSEYNYQIRSLAYIVRENVPFPIELKIVPDASDARNYYVSFTRAEPDGASAIVTRPPTARARTRRPSGWGVSTPASVK